MFLPFCLPGVRHAANDGAEHESSDKGEKHEVDEAFQSVITQPRHGLDIILQKKGDTTFIMTCTTRSESSTKHWKQLKVFVT